MKKILLVLTVMTIFACKKDKKETESATEPIAPIKKELLTSVKFPAYPGWGKVGVDIIETEEMYLSEKTFVISRSDQDSKSSYAHTQKIPVEYANVYKASIKVKKGMLGNLFGIRIAGDYPDRVDAVFNLEEGTVIGVQKTRDFENESANIEHLGDGWYECSVRAEVVADYVAIYLGPTKGKDQAKAWTVRTVDKCDAYMIPSSLKLEKVSIE